jgi:hypothetical protein
VIHECLESLLVILLVNVVRTSVTISATTTFEARSKHIRNDMDSVTPCDAIGIDGRCVPGSRRSDPKRTPERARVVRADVMPIIMPTNLVIMMAGVNLLIIIMIVATVKWCLCHDAASGWRGCWRQFEELERCWMS